MSGLSINPVSIALTLSVVLGLSGLLLLVTAIRGRRIDDHPRCRECGYDLSGHTATPEVCPECGRNLSRSKRAVRIGHRRRRPVRAVLGVLMLVVSLSALMTIVWIRSSQVRLIEYYPVWLLRMELESGDPASADGAIAELLRRYESGDLTVAQVTMLIERLVAQHSILTAHWTDQHSRFVESTWASGDLNDDRFAKYVKAAIDQAIVLSARPKMRSGQSLMVQSELDAIRLSSDFNRSSTGGMADRVFVLQKRYEIRNGDELLWGARHATTSAPIGSGYSATSQSMTLDLEPGDYDLTVVADLQMYLITYGIVPIDTDDPNLRVASWRVAKTVPVSVLSPDEHFIALIADDDPVIATQLRDSVIIDLSSESIRIENTTQSYETGRGFVDLHRPPIDVAFTVYGHLDGVETVVGSFARKAGQRAGGGWLHRPVRNVYPDAEAIDIILRPDRAAAERTMNIDAIWGGELVFEDVPLRKSPTGDGED